MEITKGLFPEILQKFNQIHQEFFAVILQKFFLEIL